jgi:excisionase family DNA binding protein
MAIQTELPDLLDIAQLSQHLGIRERHVRRLISERRIPYIKVGRLIRFDPDDIAAWLDEARRPDNPRRESERRTR